MADEQVNRQEKSRKNECSLCGEPAVIRYLNPEKRLCGYHFVRDVEDRVRENIRDKGIVSEGDRILVGLSGGKDSTALLLILHSYVSSVKGCSIVTVTVDEGIKGYREDTVDSAKSLTLHLGVEHRIISFGELFGDSLDGLVLGREDSSCSICGVLRRRALLKAAEKYGASKIATGHNLDDEAQSVLMNVLRGDLPSLVQDTSEGNPGFFIPRIKPLSVLSEREIVTYLLVRGFFSDLPECPYAKAALRSEIRRMLLKIESKYPQTRERLMAAGEKLKNSGIKKEKGEFKRCKICGEFSSSEICRVCMLLEKRKPD